MIDILDQSQEAELQKLLEEYGLQDRFTMLPQDGGLVYTGNLGSEPAFIEDYFFSIGKEGEDDFLIRFFPHFMESGVNGNWDMVVKYFKEWLETVKNDLANEIPSPEEGESESNPPPPPEAQGKAVVTASTLNVRNAPNLQAPKVNALTKGTVVDVFEEADEWIRIAESDEWVSKQYLRFVREEEAEGEVPEGPFGEALKKGRQKKGPRQEQAREPRTFTIEVAGSINIVSGQVEGVIGVKDLSRDIAELLSNMSDDKGMMVGLFGRWGRGKTFLWREIWKSLEAREGRNPFYKVEFHAWKYQDTPASWAYLYESLAEEFYRKPKTIFSWRWFPFGRKLLALNLKRKGWGPILAFIGAIFWVSVTWLMYNLVPFDDSLVLTSAISGLSVIFLTTFVGFAKYLQKTYSSKAVDIFRKYSSRRSFLDVMGIQAEIQKELKALLKVWIPESRVGQKRVLLFVDDIDRCGEEKIIEIIDALKVMLEEEEIAKRIVVLAAIDERVLKRAINQKYYRLIDQDLSLDDEKKREKLRVLTREYMDKLFITGVKLGNLTREERGEIFDAFTKNRGKVNLDAADQGDKNEGADNMAGNGQKRQKSPPKGSTSKAKAPGTGGSDGKRFLEPEPMLKLGSPDYELEQFEYTYLRSNLSFYVDATPRAIRIYYYRYLLAKSIMDLRFSEDDELRSRWHRPAQDKSVLPLLIIHYSGSSNPETLIRDKIELINNDQESVMVTILDKEYQMDKELLTALYQVIEMVVPY